MRKKQQKKDEMISQFLPLVLSEKRSEDCKDDGPFKASLLKENQSHGWIRGRGCAALHAENNETLEFNGKTKVIRGGEVQTTKKNSIYYSRELIIVCLISLLDNLEKMVLPFPSIVF